MKTEELIVALATAAEAVDRRAPTRRLLLAASAGLVIAAALTLALLGPNPALADDARQAAIWVKLAFAAAAVAGAVSAAAALARPGMPLARPARLAASPFLALWILAAAALWLAAPGERLAAILGNTWQACPQTIAALSVPALALALLAMRGLAPTRLWLAGAGAGLLAGAVAALAYALHCPELSLPFIGVWYVLGMATPVAAGAALGPLVLRW